MKKLNFRLAFRNIFRNKLHSSINILGFAVGIAVFMLIVRYVNHQFSFDGFHSQNKNIYKIHLGDNKSLPPATAQFLKDNISGIEDVVRLDEWFGGGSKGYLKNENVTFRTSDLLFTDSSFFNFFDFELLYGETKQALSTPNSIILSESLSKKIFGNVNPTGKQIEYLSDYPSATYSFTIQGVIADNPDNSSIQYNGLISMSTIEFHHIRNGNIGEDWSNWGFGTFVKLQNPEIATQINSESPKFWTDFVAERWKASKDSPRAQDYKLTFVPLEDVHFMSGTKRSSVYLIFLIGLIILLIAIINYINLSIAISTSRVKEIGIRKVIGAGKGSLFREFIAESIVVTSISAVLAVLIMYVVHPYLYDFTGFNVIVEHGKIFGALLLFTGGLIFIGYVSGIYPAWFLTNVAPVQSLKNEFNKGKKGNALKHILITLQFVVSIFLLISVITISKQVNFINTKELGFDKEHIVYLSGGANLNQTYQSFREALLKNPTIQNVARTNGTFAGHLNIGSKHKVNGEYRNYKATTVDADFIETFGIELIEGRNFFRSNKNDQKNSVLVNESFVSEMELDEPIGSKVTFLEEEVIIIGVVKDFYISSLHQEIQPSLLSNMPWNVCVNIKISESDIQNTIATIERTWKEFLPDVPFEYHFLDENFDDLYKAEVELSLLIRVFSILAVFIACLGLFGLISYSSVQRKKEIGVRKINGAKVIEVITLLNRDFIKWVAIAFVVACPIAWYAMHKWLENFAYKTTLSWWIFALAGVLALGIALLTVSWQSWRAATRNPVEALRYE
ncbi:ABC transporter permease [Draconibacterium sp.]|uniref:ABC transporter permease n=1 Tax=Draconibacterium sp. TaxID=1965318 RepID=UPI00356A6C18